MPCLWKHRTWGCSSAGRAPALQAGGQEFDPPHLHHQSLTGLNAATGETMNYLLTTIWAHSSGWLERTPDKREVGGSSPLVPTMLELL